MKLVKLTLICLIMALGALMVFDSRLFSREVFSIFQDRIYSAEGQKKAEDFDPESEIFNFPKNDNKEFFKSLEDLSICRKKDVRKFIYLYLTGGREYIRGGIENASFYLPLIEEVFRRHNDLPRELMLLPLLESGFNPRAVSRSKAMGLWQFIKSTGNIMGLKDNRWVDERRDVEKSTGAALQHLRNLYSLYNNWELALAAYNGGAGYISRAMKKTGAKTFWELQKSGVLRDETSEYVSRFAALVIIYQNQKLFGLHREIRTRPLPETLTITAPRPVDINALSRRTGTPVELIRKLNPELKTRFTPDNDRDYTLRLPRKVVSKG